MTSSKMWVLKQEKLTDVLEIGVVGTAQMSQNLPDFCGDSFHDRRKS